MAFKMRGYSAGEGTGSMAKQNKRTTVYEGRDNKKGQSQKDILEKRNKDITDYDDAVSEYTNEEGELDITRAQYEAYKKKHQALIDAQTTSSDSINTVNKNMNLKIEADNKKKAEKKNKKADDSGLFMKSPKTMAKQRVVSTYDSDKMKNTKGQTQSDVLNSRNEKIKLNLSEKKRFNDYIKKKYPDGFINEANLAKVKAKFKTYDTKDSTNRANWNASADSINVVNANAKKAKDAKLKSEGDEIDNF